MAPERPPAAHIIKMAMPADFGASRPCITATHRSIQHVQQSFKIGIEHGRPDTALGKRCLQARDAGRRFTGTGYGGMDKQHVRYDPE